MMVDKKVLAILGFLVVDILLWSSGISWLLLPFGAMYLIASVALLANFLSSSRLSFLNMKYLAVIVRVFLFFIASLLIYEVMSLDMSCNGCKAKFWNMSFSNITGVIAAFGLILMGPKFSNCKSVLLLLAFLSISWAISEPFTEYQLSLAPEDRSGVYDFPVLSPFKDAFRFVITLYGTISFFLVLTFVYPIVGAILIFKNETIPNFEGCVLVIALSVFTFFSTNWGMVHFDI